jgi:hypothetical protein
MSSSTVSKNKPSQNVVAATSASSSQYRSSTQYQSSSQYQPSRIDQSQTVRQSSNTQSSVQNTNYFGPVRSSIIQGMDVSSLSVFSSDGKTIYNRDKIKVLFHSLMKVYVFS